MKDPKPDVAKF
jgi:endo-1,3(4)-beta-glucanase